MSVRDIESHLQRLYGTTALGRDTITRVTDAVLADVQAWRTRPLERGRFLVVVANQVVVRFGFHRAIKLCWCAVLEACSWPVVELACDFSQAL